MADVLSIVFDHAQQRLKTRSARIALLGPELFDEKTSLSGQCMILPLANCLVMKPYQMDAEYDSSNAAPYTKYTIGGGYNVLTAGIWKPHEDFNGAGNFYACDEPGAGEYIATTAVVGLNRPMVLSFQFNEAGDKHVILDCGYSSSSIDPEAAEIGFKVWSHGMIELWKNGTWLADLRGFAWDKSHINRVIIWPCKRREIVIFAVGYEPGGDKTKPHEGVPGRTERYVFDDIDEDETAPVITPNLQFFVRPGAGGTGNLKVQFQPLTFPQYARSNSRTWSFGKPPATTAVLFEQWVNALAPTVTKVGLYMDTSYAGADTVDLAGLVLATNTATDFTPNGIRNQCKLGIRLKSGNSAVNGYSPFIYGAVSQYDPASVFTATDEEDLSGWALSYSLSVPDSPFGAKMDVEMLAALETFADDEDTETSLETIVPRFSTMSFRPVKFAIGAYPAFLDGILRRPRLKDGREDIHKRFTFEVETMFRMLESYRATTRMPFDGFPLCCPPEVAVSAVWMVLRETGLFTDLDKSRCNFSNLGYIIGQVPHENCAEWNVAWEIGESALQMLDKLHRLASDCFMGEHPGPDGPEFWFLTKEDLEAIPPVMTLYRNETDAMGLEPSLSEIEAVEQCYHDNKEETCELEATEVWAMTVDPRTGGIIQSYGEDTAAADPETAPSSRPDNWTGYPLSMGVSARELRTQDGTDRAVTALLPVATQQQTVGEFSANTLLMYESGGGMLPLWRGDSVTLDGVGDRRISSLSASFVKEVPDANAKDGTGFWDRRARYTTGAILGRGGNSMREIQNAQQMRSFEDFVNDLRKAPLFATGVVQVSNVALP